MSAEIEFERIAKRLAKSHESELGQMFGKRCIKISGKAGIALFQDCVVFKLPESEHEKLLVLAGAQLWDPSGKGRAMKEWVQIPVAHKASFNKLAKASADYVV